MERIKKLLRRIWAFLNDSRLEKPLIITAPCLTLILVGLILYPHIQYWRSGAQDTPAVVPTARTVEISLAAAPVASAEPTPIPTPEPSDDLLIPLSLRAISVYRDINITVLGEDGRPVSGQLFRLDVLFPNGSTYSYDTEGDGSGYYLVRLDPGEYRISMQPHEGFAVPEPVTCTVEAQAQYNQITDIESVAEVKDVTEMSQSEIPHESPQAPEEVVAEVIITPDEPKEETTQATTEPAQETTPDPEPTEEPAEVPAQVIEPVEIITEYRYEFSVGPNGYLLYRGTSEESQVLPIDEDGDGVFDYGLYYVTAEQTEQAEDKQDEETEEREETQQPEQQSYTVSVELYKPDGSPVDDYEYTAVEVTQQQEQLDTAAEPEAPVETVTPIMPPSPTENQEAENKVGWQEIDGNTYYFMEDGTPAVGLKQIDGKLYYFSQYGVKASSIGIDVSYYNNDIDWQAVKAQGIDFAIIRVGGRGWTSGALYGDSRTQEYLRGARNAGLRIGVYFYSTAVNPYEAVEEASVALNTIGGISLDYPIFIDMEYSGEYPNGRSDQLTASERAEIAVAFCETVRNSGYRAGIYSGQNFYKHAIDYGSISRYTVWLASYTLENQLPNFANRYDIWQFTDRAKISGIDGGVDMNVIF